MQLACLIILIGIFCLILVFIGVQVIWMRQDKKELQTQQMFIQCFDDLTRTIEAYYELMEKLIDTQSKVKESEEKCLK